MNHKTSPATNQSNENSTGQFFITKREIVNWLEKYRITNFIINDDLTVDVNNNVNLSNLKLKYLPVKFNKIKFSFNIKGNQLKNLKGCPFKVNDSFNCSHNELKSLMHAPLKVGQHFDCSFNQLTTLEHLSELNYRLNSTKTKENIFNCSYNSLSSFGDIKHSFKKHFFAGFDCSNNNLTSLVGSPEQVSVSFKCSYNKLTNLAGGPFSITDLDGEYFCNNNFLESFVGSPKIFSGKFLAHRNKIKSFNGFNITNIGLYGFYFTLDAKNFDDQQLFFNLQKYYNLEADNYYIDKFNIINFKNLLSIFNQKLNLNKKLSKETTHKSKNKSLI